MKETRTQARNRQRQIKRIYEMIKDKKALFLTLTFRDDVMQSTNKATRQKYIKEFLKDNTAEYIANLDYGEENKREHYHAIIKITTLSADLLPSNLKIYTNRINYKAYPYGRIKAEFINKKYEFVDEKSIKNCALKLWEHSHKESTNHEKIIYSRKPPTTEKQLQMLIKNKKANPTFKDQLKEFELSLNIE